MKRRTFLALAATASLSGLAAAAKPHAASYHNVTSLVFAPDGSLAVASIEGASQIWKVPSLDLGQNLGPFLRGAVAKMAYSQDGHLLAVGMLDTTLRVYDWKTRQKLFELPAAGADLTGLSFSPDGKYLAVGVYNQHGAIVSVHSKDRVAAMPGSVAAFNHDGSLLAVAGSSGQVQILDVVSNKTVTSFPIAKGYVVNAVAFSPPGDSLALGCGDKKIYLYSMTGWKPQQVLEGHGAIITGLAWLPSGKALVSSALESDARLWNEADGKWSSKPLHGHRYGLTFAEASRDGRYLATGAVDGSVCLWTPEGKLLKQRLIRPVG